MSVPQRLGLPCGLQLNVEQKRRTDREHCIWSCECDRVLGGTQWASQTF